MKNLYRKIIGWFILTIGKVHWETNYVLTNKEQAIIREMLVKDYFVILTRRRNHLSTFFVNLADFILTGKWGFWSHALMNLEDEVSTDKDFRLMEATGVGVHYTPFENVFDVQDAVLLKPKNMDLTKWTEVLDKAKSELGKPYDTLFNIADESALSCVELVRTILMSETNYARDFANFELLIKSYKNLSPQMLYDCDDFEIAYIAKA